jgi:hypothetical protein
MPKNTGYGAGTWQSRQTEANAGNFAGAGNSFAARFGRVILQHGIAALPSALYHFGGKLDLYAQHVWFISYILSHKWDEDLPYPSLGVMSRASGMSKRQLQRYSDELQGMGYLLVLPRRSQERGQESNYYDFAALFEQLEARIAENAANRSAKGDTNPISSLFDPSRAPEPTHHNGHENGIERGIDDIERAQHDPSFVARYGRVLARYGVAAVPRALFTCSKELGMTPQQVWFVAYIFSYQWDTSLPYPSIVRMSTQTGYTTAYLHRIKTGLVERGSLRLIRRTKSDGGQDSNAYDFSPLLDEIRKLLKPTINNKDSTPPSDEQGEAGEGKTSEAIATIPVKKARRGSLAAQARRDRAGVQVHTLGGDTRYAQASDVQYTPPNDAQYSLPHDTQHIAPNDGKYAGGSDSKFIAPGAASYTQPGDKQLPPPVKQKAPHPVTGSVHPPVTPSAYEIEAGNRKQQKKDDSSHPSQVNIVQDEIEAGNNLAYSPFISRVATDFSYELGDVEHVLENAAQALKLWRSSGLQAEAFVDLMYSAKRATRSGQGKHGALGLSNKMAYFFACLRRLVSEASQD